VNCSFGNGHLEIETLSLICRLSSTLNVSPRKATLRRAEILNAKYIAAMRVTRLNVRGRLSMWCRRRCATEAIEPRIMYLI